MIDQMVITSGVSAAAPLGGLSGPADSLHLMVAPGLTVVVHTGDLATTVLAALGVLLGVASLGWQAMSFRLAGSRVSVVIGAGMKGPHGAATKAGGALSRDELDLLLKQGFTDGVVSVAVSNAGRSPTSVVEVEVLFSNGGAYSLTTVDPPLPFRLEGEDKRTWYFDGAEVRAVGQAFQDVSFPDEPLTIQVRVRLGGHKEPFLSQNVVDFSSAV